MHTKRKPDSNMCVRAHPCSVRSDSLGPHGLACQSPLSMGFSRQEYWSGLPFLFPRDLPKLWIKPMFPALAGEFFTTEPVDF